MKIERIDLDTFPVAVMQMVNDHNLFAHDPKMQAYQANFMAEGMAYELRALLLGKKGAKVESVRVPLTWWDHFKHDHFPAWLRNRFPPKYREIVTTENRICPHIDTRFSKNSTPHITWLKGDAE